MELKAHNLQLPSQIVLNWILSNLGVEFNGFVSNITQSFRQNIKAYDFDTLTLAILNKSKHYKYKNQANTVTNPSEKSNSDKKD